MILFLILLLILVILTVFSVFILSVGGAAFIVVFGDVIVCAAIIIWIMKRVFGKKKK